VQPPATRANLLLMRLPEVDRAALTRVATLESYPLSVRVLKADTASEYAFFPTTCVISLVRTLKDRSTIEVGLVGKEGMVGVDVFLDGEIQPNDAVIQGAGETLRVSAVDLRKLFAKRPAIQTELLRFTNGFIRQLAQTVACNRLHEIEPRLARWLLMMDDRTGGGAMKLTQRFLSHMLGSRTAGINEAVQRLEAKGVIVHRRQNIEIIDRPGLEKLACECYETVRRDFAQRLEASDPRD
jgi:CRP-like cAMP-binding protein